MEGLGLGSLPDELRTARYSLVLRREKDRTHDQTGQLGVGNDEISDTPVVLDGAPEDNNGIALMGMWNRDELIGHLALTPDEYGSAEINFWLAERFRGKGYASLAVRALANYMSNTGHVTYAKVDKENKAVSSVLERAGFATIAEASGKLIFSFGDIGEVKEHKHVSNLLPAIKDEQSTIAVPLADIEKSVELPNRRLSIIGSNDSGNTVFLSLSVAKKLYKCPCCQRGIDIGAEHVILSLLKASKKYNHHHLDLQCVQQNILPTLHNVREVLAKETSPKVVNKRRRRWRRANQRHIK